MEQLQEEAGVYDPGYIIMWVLAIALVVWILSVLF